MEVKKVKDEFQINCSDLEINMIANTMEVYTNINPHDILVFDIKDMIDSLRSVQKNQGGNHNEEN